MNDLVGLRYEFYEEGPPTGVLLEFNTIGRLDEVVLSKNSITVRVYDLLGMYIDKRISVEISPLNANSEIVQGLIDRVNLLLQYGDKAGAVRLISAISDLTVEMDGKPEVIKTLLNFIDKVNYNDFVDIKRYSHILKKIVTQSVQGNINGLNSESCKVAARIMKKLSRKVLGEFVNIYNKSTEITALQLRNVIGVVLQTGDVVLSSRDPMVFNESAGALQVFGVYRNFKQAASDVVLSIERLGRSVGHILLPAQPEVIFQTNKSTLWIKLDTPERLHHMTQIPSTGNSFVKISEALMKALKKKSDVIRLEVAVLQQNPYWWDQNGINIRTEIISLRLFLKVSKHMVLIHNLPEPIDIFFNLSDFLSQEVSGFVTKPNSDATDDEKDKAVSVHRLDTRKSGGSGKIMIMFKNLKPYETLKVIVKENIRPDYNMVNNEGFVITNVSPKYDTFFMSSSPDAFLYVGILPGLEVPTNTTIVYTFEMYSVQCQTWSGGEWNSKICKVGTLTTNDVIHCQCIHLSIFGGSILIAPNKLDPIKDIGLFLTIPDNPAVVILVLTLLIIYLSILVWAFSKDKKDKAKKLVIVLEDNFPGEEWGYLIIVFTGARLFAGTSANVGFQITGEFSSSRAHVFRCEDRKVLQKGSDDWFLIFTPKHLGELQTLHIWHDNSGPNPDWYCIKVLVHDLTFNKEYSFLVESWLCIGTFGKYVEAVTKPSLPKDTSNWDRLLASNAFYYFREAHLWISIFFCHPRTCLTRTQRVSIATSLVMCSLLTSIMFYGVAADEGVDEGSYSIKTREIIIAIESALITAPVTFLIVFLFRKSRFIQSENQEEQQEEIAVKKDENKNHNNLKKR